MKLKQLLSVVLMLCMVASSCVAFAAPQFDEAYECSGVSFGYQDGETWTDADSLKGGQEISAKVSVSKTGDKENAVFSLFVYKNGKMYDNEIVTLEVGSEPVEFKATASVPADPEGCQAVAVLWNNFYDMEMLCDSALFPSANTKLRGLYTDGELIEGFDPDVTEYSYALATDAQKYPDISWQAADSSVKVTYKKPTTFPGKSIVIVEAADGSKTEYSINYVSEVGSFISNIGGLATNPVYVKGGVVVGGTAYNDRDYKITAIGDPSYEGADLIQGSITWQSNATFKSTESDWITFNAARGVTVKVLKSDTGATQHFIDAGFTMETTDLATGFVRTKTNEVKNHKIAMSKHFDAGKVSIPAGNSGTTYLVAIIFDPIGGAEQNPDEPADPDEPVVPEDKSLALESISIDGVALEGFDASVNEYTHILTTAQLTNAASPEVTFTLMDETSTAEVSVPESFPGSVKITVYGKDSNTNTYTINYLAETVKDLALNEVAGANAPQPVFEQNFKIGDAIFFDRPTNFLTTYIDEAYVGKDRISYASGWLNNTGKQYQLAFVGDRVDWVTFTAARDMEVIVFEAANADSEYIGFTAQSSTTPYITAHASSNGDLNYKYKYTKKFSAGEKVALPNVCIKGQRIGTVVINVAPWGGFGEEGGEEPEIPEVPDEPDIPEVPDEPEVDSLALTEIKIDGAALQGFEGDTTEYSYTLTPNQVESIEAPVVTYTLADAENSSAVVTNPTEFPGSVTITVTNKDSQTRTYTVDYRSNAVLTDITVADSSVRPPDFVSGGFVVGEAPYHNRSYPIQEINDESLVGRAMLHLTLQHTHLGLH